MKKCPSVWCLVTDCECLHKLTGWIATPLLFLMRVYWGWQFFVAGKGKFLEPAKVAGFFESLGIPFAHAQVYIVASIETFGGLLLLLGLGSRVAAIPLTAVMVVAYLTAHIDAVKTLFTDPNNFISQDPFLFLLTALLVLAFGPGRLSLDYLIRARCSGGCCCGEGSTEEGQSSSSCCS